MPRASPLFIGEEARAQLGQAIESLAKRLQVRTAAMSNRLSSLKMFFWAIREKSQVRAFTSFLNSSRPGDAPINLELGHLDLVNDPHAEWVNGKLNFPLCTLGHRDAQFPNLQIGTTGRSISQLVGRVTNRPWRP